MTRRERLALWLASAVAGQRLELAAVTAGVDDSPGWVGGGGAHDRDWSEAYELYTDTLKAWRSDPFIRRVIETSAAYVLGDGVRPSSPVPAVDSFLRAWWDHDENRMEQRLPEMVQELHRAGDLFVVLFRNPADGMSYVRFVTRDQVQEIRTAANDWEKETEFVQAPVELGGRPVVWQSPAAARRNGRAVMLHYAVNRPIGALFGESDVATIVRWASRYDRMVADRVRLHMALRVFLWFVKVPSNRIAAKLAEYREPPAPGSVVVHDAGEEWTAKQPNVQAFDASSDLQAVRQMVGIGSGLPPHWLSERGFNRAEAHAMAEPAVRVLMQRQRYVLWMLRDLARQAYMRAAYARPDLYPPLPDDVPYDQLIVIEPPELSRGDNLELARAAASWAEAWERMTRSAGSSRSLFGLMLRAMMRFGGEQPSSVEVDQIVEEVFSAAKSDVSDEPA